MRVVLFFKSQMVFNETIEIKKEFILFDEIGTQTAHRSSDYMMSQPVPL